jgi:hypothetical protein
VIADLHATTDAKVWTDEFFRLHGDRLAEVDWGLMISWFANAIEVGRIAGEAWSLERSREVADLRDRLTQAEAKPAGEQ